MRKPGTLEERVRRLEDRAEIAELIAMYGLVMDSRDLSGLPDLFTADAVVSSAGGGMHAAGRDAVVQLFVDRFRILGPSNHVTHDRITRFDPQDPDHATGLVLSHAEMQVEGRAMLAALRYVDRYRRTGDRWRFAERRLHFMYYVAATAYPLTFAGDGGSRQSGGEPPAVTDWSEQVLAWRAHYAAWPE